MLEQPETPPTFCCTQCSHQAVWPFQLDNHIQRNHRNAHASELFKPTLEPEQYTCFCCHFKSNYRLHRYEHCQNEHDISTIEGSNIETRHIRYSCDYCKTKELSLLCFVKHHSLCEKTRSQVPTSSTNEDLKRRMEASRSRFMCAKCSYLTGKKSDLKKHNLTKHADVWFSCTKCSYKVKNDRTLKKHMSLHGEQQVASHNCDKCRYTTARKTNLKRHMLRHATPEEIGWFHCTECSYRGKQKFYLQRHMLTHIHQAAAAIDQLDDWLSCTHCSYRTRRQINLKLHKKTHAKDDDTKTWFNCSECSYRTSYDYNFRRHRLTHVAKPLIAPRRMESNTGEIEEARVMAREAIVSQDGLALLQSSVNALYDILNDNN